VSLSKTSGEVSDIFPRFNEREKMENLTVRKLKKQIMIINFITCPLRLFKGH